MGKSISFGRIYFVKGRGVLVIVAVLCVAAVLTVILLPHESEPRYGGRALSDWLERAAESRARTGNGPPDPNDEAVKAVRAIGTDAIPYLVRWIDYDRPSWRKKLLGTSPWARPFWIRRPIMFLFELGGSEKRLRDGRLGFQILGPEAKAAVPELKRLFLKYDTEAEATATFALISIGEPGIREINSVATNSDMPENVRARAAYLMTNMPAWTNR